jgi:hypothetical protein
MTADDLTAALRACAAGLYPLEAGTDLLISNRTFLHRDDFTSRFITCDSSGGSPMAAIDWDAAITALDTGGLPCSGGERRILVTDEITDWQNRPLDAFYAISLH